MKQLSLLLLLASIVSLGAGCAAEKTPEETEAAKYPKVNRLSPEEEKALRARAGLDTPIGAKGAPPSSHAPAATGG